MLETRINLQGLAAVVRLKTDLLRQLARSRSEEWQRHIDSFIDGVDASELENPIALFVLLADLVEEIRVLLGQDALADSASGGRSTASPPAPQCKNEVLAKFPQERRDLLPATPI